MRGELFSPQQIEVLDRLFDRQPSCPIQSSSDLYVSPDSGKVRAWQHAGSGLRLSLGTSYVLKLIVACCKQEQMVCHRQPWEALRDNLTVLVFVFC